MSSTTPVQIPASPPGAAPRPVSWPASPKPGPAPAKRRSRWPIVLTAIVLIVGIAGTLGITKLLRPAARRDIQLYTIVPRSFPVILEEKGELKAANSIEIRSELEGKATIINLVDEGVRVKKGDLLVELASDVIDNNIRDQEIAEATAQAAFEAASKELDILRDENASKIRKAALALEMAELAKEKYEKGESRELKTEATLAVEKAVKVLERAESDYNDSKQLFEQGFLTRIELDTDQFKAYEAGVEVQKAKLGLEVLETYTIKMSLKEKASDVNEAEKELDRTSKSAIASEAKGVADASGKKAQLDVVRQKLAKLRDQKSKSRILAPADGLVVFSRSDGWWRSETQIEKGAQVFERQSLIELPDTSAMKIVIRVHEAQIENLKIGLPASIEIEGFANRSFTGRVSKIGVLADSQNRWLNPDLKEYETSIMLDGSFKDLKPGTTARARVEIAQLDKVIAVPVQAVFARSSKHFVFLEKNGNVEVAAVDVGLASADYVEIKNGVRAGQVVRLAVTDEMKLLLPPDEGKAKPAVKPPVAASQPAGRRSK